MKNKNVRVTDKDSENKLTMFHTFSSLFSFVLVTLVTEKSSN